MAIPTTKQELIDYCLRSLGHPVININVATEQLDDRIDEAVQVWQEKHFDATEKTWIGYIITQQDIDDGFITLPADIHIVDYVMALSDISNLMNDSVDDIFSYKYQFMMNNLSPFQPLDMLNYYLSISNINEANFMLNPQERFEFTKHGRKLVLFRGKELRVGDRIAFHAYKYITSAEVWNDKWLKAYSVALIKRQFGLNMKKHGEIQLLGGITVNGQQYYDEAVLDIERLETELRETYMEPPMFIIG